MKDSRRWLFTALRWDGALPLFVCAVSLVISTLFKKNDGAEITVVILLPMLAALVRAAKGRGQLAAISGCHPSILRQLGLAAAIIVLLLFEIFLGMLLRAQPPWFVWWPAPLLYVLYLALILVSLRPGSGGANEPPAPVDSIRSSSSQAASIRMR